MKKLLLLLFITPFFIACNSNDSEAEEININPKEYIVSLGVTGEITDITEEPLKATTNNDLYGFQVYSSLSDKDTYEPYAYGLFDNISSLSIKLNEGYKYRFVCTLIPNGKDLLYKYDDGYFGTFSPDHQKINIGASFEYNNKITLKSLSFGAAILKDKIDQSFSRPNINRFYGELTDYFPSENSSISLHLKRVVFGAKIIAENLTEGELRIHIDSAPSLSIKSDGNLLAQDIFCFEGKLNNDGAWMQDDYSETISVLFIWVKSNGNEVPIENKKITFKRNTLTTIKIKVNDGSTSGGERSNTINIDNEQTSLKEGETILI